MGDYTTGKSTRPAPGYTTYLKPASGGASGTSNTSAGHLQGVNPSNPCERLSETDPAQCPMTHGASGAAINTAKTCVYSPACAASGGLDCFEQTGCKYANFPSNPCESLSETDPAKCPLTHGASGA